MFEKHNVEKVTACKSAKMQYNFVKPHMTSEVPAQAAGLNKLSINSNGKHLQLDVVW
jgi:hypothetical protein